MLKSVTESEQESNEESTDGVSTLANPFPAFNAATDEESVMTVRVNTARLEQYLQSIKEKLSSYEAASHEQLEIVSKLSKADETKIAKLSVKLDHCIIDVNTFKDFVLSRQASNNELRNIGVKSDHADTTGDHKYVIAQLQSEVSALSLMVRRIELNQAEGLDSFAQIKQLNSALKTVTKELDSLGKNSVILELRDHVDRIVSAIRSDMAAAGAQREADIREVRQSFNALEEDRLAFLEQRLQIIEEKTILYDVVLSENGGGDAEEEAEAGEDPEGDKLLLTERGEATDANGALTEDGEPLRPSQMLLRGDSSGFREEDEFGSPGTGSGPPSPTGATTELAGAMVRMSSVVFQNMSNSSKLRTNRSLTTDSAGMSGRAMGSFSFKGGGEGSSGRFSGFSQKLSQGVASRDRESSMAVAPSGGKRGRESALKRSSFFTNLMGQYVSRENHEEALDAEHAFAQRGIFGLQRQLKVLATTRMCAALSKAQVEIMKWKYRHGFAQLVANVRNWNAVRNRRNRSKAMMFQVRLQSLLAKRIKRMGLEYWRRVTWLFKERDRLKLWLRTKLQHWINMKVPNVKIYLNRWKRFTVHSYYSSMFVEEEEGESTAISDDFQRLLNSENFSVYEVKRIAHEDMKRRWAHRARQERLLLQQESAIREHVHKVTMAITGGTFPGFQGAVSAEEFAALKDKCYLMDEGLTTMRLDLRRILNELQDSDSAVDAKIDAESRKITGEFNVYRSQVAVRFNDCKEGLLVLQGEMRAQFEAEQKRIVRLEDHLKIIERRLDGEQSKIAPLVAEQQRMHSLLDGMKSELRCTDTQLGALHGQIDRAIGASQNTVESNKRMERTLAENSEYYDVELKFMRNHVTESVASLAAMKAEKQAFVDSVEARVQVMLNDLNNFVERLPAGKELFDVCVDYENMWVRLHSDGLEGTAELQALPDKLHSKVSQLALRIAHHIAAAADRLVLARWTAGATAKKAMANPQEAPKLVPVHGSAGVAANKGTAGQKDTLLSELQPESSGAPGADVPSMEGACLTDNLQVKVSFNMPSADLIEQVRDELFNNYLSAGFISLLRASDDALGPPGLLKSSGRATFQRKLKKSVEAALTKYPVMLDPAQASQAAALSLARSSKKQHLARFISHTGQAVSLPKRLNAEFDTCVSCGHELAAQLHGHSQQPQAQSNIQAQTPFQGQFPITAASTGGMAPINELSRPYSGTFRQNPNNLSTPTLTSLMVPHHSPVQPPPPHAQFKRQDTPSAPLDMFGSLEGSSSCEELAQLGRPDSPTHISAVVIAKRARPQSGKAPATATFTSSNNAPDMEGSKARTISSKRPASASAALRHREAMKDAQQQQELRFRLDERDAVPSIQRQFREAIGDNLNASEYTEYDGAQSRPAPTPAGAPSSSYAAATPNPYEGKSSPSIPAHVRGFGGSAGAAQGSSSGGIAAGAGSSTGSPNMRSSGRESSALMQHTSPGTAAGGPQLKGTPLSAGARVGSGFGLPVQSFQQGSNLLAHQLAHRFQQDASFHGTGVRKMDSTDLLEPIQASRKLFGTHQ